MGASKAELDLLEPKGYAGALDWLIDYEKNDEGWHIDPYQICFETGMKDTYVDPYRFATVWSLRMLLSQRPLEQKLTLFWHDHFAVSGGKVEFGPPIWSYLETLRTNANDFPTLLKKVSFEPAMLRFLDGDTSLKDHPNENFGRELLELFTLGQGHYTEADVKEVSRAFTGWGNRYLIYENGGEQVQERIKSSIETRTPMVAACFSPELHDDGAKHFLGLEAYNAEEVLSKLAAHPQTAVMMTGKLWDYFAGCPLSDSLGAKLAQTFTSNNGAIKPVLRAIAGSDEFWSDACVWHRVKSPVDFIVPVMRQVGVGTYVNTVMPKPEPMKPMGDVPRSIGGMLLGLMVQQGMMLLFPPDVAGWNWGQAWITPGNMVAKLNLGATMSGVDQPDKGLVMAIGQLVLAAKPVDDAAAVDALCVLYDAPIPVAKRKILVEAFTKGGGLASLTTPEGASKAISGPMKLIFGAPEFQSC
ncbi:hypothetical protein BH11ARM1_BH11ARM1_02990 [soil metagenome]